MHIPDGYLSPATSIAMYGASFPFWYFATKRVQRFLTGKMVPLLSVLSAFAFTVQMLNIPLPGGTSGHAAGAALLAIVLGPWAAVLGMSVALVIQSLFFGDGGIWAIGANAFNIAVLGSFSGYYCYHLIAGGAPATSVRRTVAAAVAGYLSLNLAALATAIELGIQPLLFKAADGSPLYAPYSLQQAVPAMMIGHLLVAGFAEAAITALVVSYLLKTNESLVSLYGGKPKAGFSARWLWTGLAALLLLTPLGLIASGTPWGEWTSDEIAQAIGYAPAGMRELENAWSAPLSGYGIPGLDLTAGYVVSGIAGVVGIIAITLLVGRWLTKREAGKVG